MSLLPVYLAAGTAVLVFLCDLVFARVAVTVGAGVLGAAATAVGAALTRRGKAFCDDTACSWVFDRPATLVAVAMAVITAVVLLLSVPTLRLGEIPAGEYAFLLTASMTGGVALGGARDLIALIVALETLTLPLYVLVGLRRKSVESAQASVTFLLTSVIATAVTLLGAALVYAATGEVRLSALTTALDVSGPARPLAGAGLVLLIAGLAFKVAVVPAHAWAPSTYDGAPLPVAAYLSTASKLGGIFALLYVVVGAGPAWYHVTGPALGVLAGLTLLAGSLVALRQRRMVRLLAWSSIAQAGFLLAPLAALGHAAPADLVTATVAYTVIYLIVELGAFAGVISLRPAGADGGDLAEYAGIGRSAPLRSAALAFAVVGLAGLPPALAGLFAKVFVLRALVDARAWAMVAVVAVAAVVGLAVYLRALLPLYRSGTAAAPRAVLGSVVLGVLTLAAVVAGFAPQVIFSLARP
ncbi:NADH-quinone oxidoreductase subunit N [Hamadaea tsunoensis]|uniref:NADH-quinone oxidoreductase subunit N n=1 Tax=Hamadaea tsunoensis TaxID=53368 RepID=UPI000424C53E|nr:proton-conducting transporter membrane subunit [Hamadaea tsunoensis]